MKKLVLATSYSFFLATSALAQTTPTASATAASAETGTAQTNLPAATTASSAPSVVRVSAEDATLIIKPKKKKPRHVAVNQAAPPQANQRRPTRVIRLSRKTRAASNQNKSGDGMHRANRSPN